MKTQLPYHRSESGLILPGSDPLERRRHGILRPDATRGMGRRGRSCYCESCTIFADDYAADDLAANWTAQSGSWAIGSGVLSTSSSNAILTANLDETAWSGGEFHPHIIQVLLKASTGNRSRIIFSYDADAATYNYVEVYWNGAASYVYLKKSDGTTIATSGSQNFTNGTSYTFKACVFASSSIVTSGNMTISGTVASATTATGLGTGSVSSTIEFDLFYLKKHYNEDHNCESCSLCTDCSPRPTQAQIVIADCTSVTYFASPLPAEVNGTFILDRADCLADSWCRFIYLFSPALSQTNGKYIYGWCVATGATYPFVGLIQDNPWVAPANPSSLVEVCDGFSDLVQTTTAFLAPSKCNWSNSGCTPIFANGTCDITALF
jgi:hypothetical protein